MKFRKKPVVIDAVQWLGTPESTLEVDAFVNGDGFSVSTGEHGVQQMQIRTLEGPLNASVGDWIIKGVKGEHYPCKPDIFAATYDAEPSSSESQASDNETEPKGK